MKFTCSRAIANELVRHRVFSFSQESTRYINYSKERHGGEITFIKPSWTDSIEIGNYIIKHDYKKGTYSANFGYVGYPQDYLTSLCEAENAYFEMLNKGCTPQQARDVLPNATKTELNMTGFTSDWRFFFDLRYYGETGKPHPDMELLASKARSEFIKAGLWDDIMKYPSRFDHE
jgi:thymidylate synthase (FAD)